MPRRLILFWMLAPALLIIGVALVGDLLLALAQSMEYMPVIGLNRFSTDTDLHVEGSQVSVDLPPGRVWAFPESWNDSVATGIMQ